MAMARIKRVTAKGHRLLISTDGKDGEVILVRGGPKRAYLWAGQMPSGDGCVTVSGEKVLRRLAQTILAELNGK